MKSKSVDAARNIGRRSVIGQYRSNITCRSCKATPRERGDQVSESAVEYECSRCLMDLEGPRAKFALGAPGSSGEGHTRGSPKSAPENRRPDAELRDTKMSTAQPLARHRKRGGWKVPTEAEARQGRRDRQRRYRSRQRRAA